MSEIEKALSADKAEQEQKKSGPQAAATAPAAEATPETAPVARGSAQSMNPDLSLIADFAAAWFSNDAHLQTGAHDPQITGFNLQQLEFSAAAAVDPYLRFDANLVFHLDGVEIEEVYGTTLDLPGRFQARFGQFLTRFGRINSTHPHSWDFVDQPFAIGRVFGGDGNRGLGVELSWLTPLPWYVEIVGSATRADGETTARSFLRSGDPTVHSLDDLLYVTAIKQFFPLSDDWSLSWGLSGAFGPNTLGGRTEVFGYDVYLKYRPITRESPTIVSLTSEWLYRRRQLALDVWDVSSYTALFWRFAMRWGAAMRWEYGSPPFDDAGHLFVGPDPLDPEWNDTRQRLTANLTHWPTEFSRFRLQGSYDMPGWRAEGIWAVFLAAELVTGAHGAHKF